MNLFQPKNRRDYLAYTIAKTFNEIDQIKQYINCCKRYSSQVIHRAFSEAKATDQSSIKRSRAALFFYLVKLYGEQSTNHSRN